MESIERAGDRLNNIHAVEPILGALRTISLGSWQAVLAQREQVAGYSRRLQAILTALLGELRPAVPDGRPGPVRRVLLLAVGSERGLCGRFNATVLEHMEGHLQDADGRQVELAILGTRLARLARRGGHSPAYTSALAVTSLPPFQLAVTLTRDWLQRYEARALDAVDVLYNAYRPANEGAPPGYTTTVAHLLPPQLPALDPEAAAPWPPPIVETDPMRLYAQLAGQWVTLQLYARLLDSAAAEHATRYQLMEAAARNAEQLIGELTLEIQSARQQAITREMQELAAGAGLVGRQHHTP